MIIGVKGPDAATLTLTLSLKGEGKMGNFGARGAPCILIRVLVAGQDDVFCEEPGMGVCRGGLGIEAEAGADTALLRVPEIAPLPHAMADVGEGADGGVISVHAIGPV